MRNLAGIFRNTEKRKALVIGDFMCDMYTIGKAVRISPEAPVAVVNVHHEEKRPGGAGNVALNLISLGFDVVACGRIGADIQGRDLLDALSEEGISTEGMVEQAGYFTPVKNRIIADNQQVVRVDHERVTAIQEQIEQKVIDMLPDLLSSVSVVAVSDYGKGFLSETLLAALMKQSQVPVLVDPKGMDFSKYRGATLIKPNLREAYCAANLDPDASLELVAEKILELTLADTLLITRSEEGITLFEQSGERRDFPTDVHEVKDVTGAGDTVLAALAFAFANRLSLDDAAHLSNIAASIAIEHLGCARVTLSEIARKLLIQHSENKIFEEDHLFTLKEALRGRQYQVLGVSEADGINYSLFRTIRQLADEHRDLLVYIRDPQPSEEFVNLITSQHFVDFVVLKSDSIQHLCSLITPDAVFILEKESLVSMQGASSL